MLCCLGQAPAIGSLTGDEGDVENAGGRSASPPEAPPEAPEAPPEALPSLATMRSAEDIDNMAALLAGKATDGDVRTLEYSVDVFCEYMLVLWGFPCHFLFGCKEYVLLIDSRQAMRYRKKLSCGGSCLSRGKGSCSTP